MLKPLQLIGKVTKLIWPRTDWNVFSETHTDSNRFQEKGSTNSKESKKYQNRSNHMQTDLNRIFSKPAQFQVEQGNIGWTSPSDWNDTALRNFCHVKWHGFKKLAMSVDDQPVLRSSFKFSASHLFYDPIILFIKPYPTQIEALYCKYIKLFKGEETRMQDSRSRSVIPDIVLFIYGTFYWRWHP